MASSSQPPIKALSPSERSYIIAGLSHSTEPTRLDGRKLQQYRNLRISYGDAPLAYGSARVVLEHGWASAAKGGKGKEPEVAPLPIGGLGGTEIVAGIKLEVVSTNRQASKKIKVYADEGDAEELGAGANGSGAAGGAPQELRPTEEWRCRVEVDVTPQAYPQLNNEARRSLSSKFSNLLADHFVPSLPPLTILSNRKYFQPHLHLSILSASSGSVVSTLFIAARCAFANLHVPRTRAIGWEAVVASDPSLEATAALDRSGTGFGGGEGGISGAVRAPKAGKGKHGAAPGQRGSAPLADDWDLEDLGGGEEGEGELWELDIRKSLPICVTLNLIPETSAFFLDASESEEAACTSRIHLMFCSRQEGRVKMCGLRIEGEEGLAIQRLPGLLKAGEGIAIEMIRDLNLDMLSSRNH